MFVIWHFDVNVCHWSSFCTWWLDESKERLCLALGDGDWNIKLRMLRAVTSPHLELDLLLVSVGDHLDFATWNKILSALFELNFDILLGLVTGLAALVSLLSNDFTSVPFLSTSSKRSLLDDLVRDILTVHLAVLHVTDETSLGLVRLLVEVFLELSLDFHLTSSITEVIIDF